MEKLGEHSNSERGKHKIFIRKSSEQNCDTEKVSSSTLNLNKNIFKICLQYHLPLPQLQIYK